MQRYDGLNTALPTTTLTASDFAAVVRTTLGWKLWEGPFLTWQRHEDMKTEITSPLIWFEDTMESSETAGTLIVLLWIWVPAEPANSVENKSSLRRRIYNIKQIESGFPDSGGSWRPDLWHKVDFKRALWHQIWTHRRPTDYIRGLPTKLVKISTYFQKQSFLPAIFDMIFFRGALMFGPLGLLNLWKSVNRIRIIMGKSGCTRIRTSSSCSPENCVTRAPLLYFIRSWVALSFKVVSESVSQASVTPFQISTFCNI